MTGNDAEALSVQTKIGLHHHLFAVAVALSGGVLGILGAFVQELRSGGALLLLFIGAPIIEESLKPTGVYLLLLRWPRLLRGQLHIAILAALSGIAFGVIESLLYVTLYASDPGEWFVIYRFTIPLCVHTLASFTFGLGINQRVVDWAAGRAPFPRTSRNAFLAAFATHGVFNALAFGLALGGVLFARSAVLGCDPRRPPTFEATQSAGRARWEASAVAVL